MATQLKTPTVTEVPPWLLGLKGHAPVITGYSFEEAWWEEKNPNSWIAENGEICYRTLVEQQLREGKDVEGFVWKRMGEPS